ncbi:MAG: family 10 glycosylhydrolase [Tannerellaceae bacterium]|jgi:uncharacterized lipoprotein YddW (UPF0748 family)|nr:family 10 glycosylhydrolase [Tannerellaceae bacterium]
MNIRHALLLLLSLALQCPAAGADSPSPKREIRAAWISTIYGMDWPAQPARNKAGRQAQQQELCDKLDLLRQANFNTVFLQVRLRGDVIYPSAIEPFNRIFSGRHGVSPGYDPLAFAIEECHKRGLECHAWFITYPIGSAADVRSKGNNSIVRRKPELCRLYNGEWSLDPGMPGTPEYILSLVREIVGNYDVDGIHFDYIRYPEQAEDFPDRATYLRYGQSKPLRAWREENINRMIARIYDWVKDHKPWVQVSSSPLGKYSPLAQMPVAGLTALDVYQDPQQWLKEQKQDMIVPMMYYRGGFFYPFVDNWVGNSNGRHVVPGLALYQLASPQAEWTLKDITAQIDYVRTSQTSGISFFRASQLFQNSKGIYTVLKEKYFKYPALLPPLAWLSRERPPAPVDVDVSRQGNRLHITWQMPNNSGQDPEPLRYTVYYSRSNSVNTTLAQNILATGLADTELYLAFDTEKEQELTFRISASNRYHIESRPSHEVYYYLSEYEK